MSTRGLRSRTMNPLLEAFTFFVLRPLNDLVMVFWRIERRFEFLYRQPFDRWLRPPIFRALQAWQNARRTDPGLALAEEFVPDDEARNIRSVIDEISAFTRENYPPGGAQRFGNSKTYGVMRAEFTVLEDIPEGLRHGLFKEPRTYAAYVRLAGPGPHVPADLHDLGQCSMGIKVMGVDGPKLMEDEQHTQDLILVTPASFVTPDIRENAKLQKWVRRKADFMYFMNPLRLPRAPHDLPGALLPHAVEPARGAVLHQRPVPARGGPGRAVLRQAVLARPRQDPRRAGGELPPRGAARDARGRGVDVRLHGAGADGPVPDADRGRDGEVARAPVPVRDRRPAPAPAPALRVRRADGVRRRAAVQPVALAARAPAAGQLQPCPPDRCTTSSPSCAST